MHDVMAGDILYEKEAEI